MHEKLEAKEGGKRHPQGGLKREKKREMIVIFYSGKKGKQAGVNKLRREPGLM